MVPATMSPPPPEVIKGGPVYKVKRLLAVRNRGRGKQFLVDWEGYRPEERQWVPSRHIVDPTLIEDFYRDHPEQPGLSGVGPRGGGTVTLGFQNESTLIRGPTLRLIEDQRSF